MEDEPLGPWGVSPPELLVVVMGNIIIPPLFSTFCGCNKGESIIISSRLIPDEDPSGGGPGGGGVVLAPPTLLVSEKVSQNILPFEFFCACCLKLPERPRPFESTNMASSDISSMESCSGRLGLDCCAVVGRAGSRSISLSRTWRTTSASRRNSDSTGVTSSASASLTRAKFFDLGLYQKLDSRVVEMSPKYFQNKEPVTYQ